MVCSHITKYFWISISTSLGDGTETACKTSLRYCEMRGTVKKMATKARAACRVAVSVSQRGSCGCMLEGRVNETASEWVNSSSGSDSISSNKAWSAARRAAHSAHSARCDSICARSEDSLSRYSLS